MPSYKLVTYQSAKGPRAGVVVDDKLFDAAVLFDHGYWVKVTRRLFKDLFGPIGIAAAVLGMMTAWRERTAFHDLLAADREIGAHLTAAELSECFDPAWYLRNVPAIYRRVGLA